MIPILGKAPGGGWRWSPRQHPVCLTESSPSCDDGQPESLYPTRRNYARVIPNDAYQGAGLAGFARLPERSTLPNVLAGGRPRPAPAPW